MLKVELIKENYKKLIPYKIELLNKYKEVIHILDLHIEKDYTETQIKRAITRDYSYIDESIRHYTYYLYVSRRDTPIFYKDLKKNKWIRIKGVHILAL